MSIGLAADRGRKEDAKLAVAYGASMDVLQGRLRGAYDRGKLRGAHDHGKSQDARDQGGVVADPPDGEMMRMLGEALPLEHAIDRALEVDSTDDGIGAVDIMKVLGKGRQKEVEEIMRGKRKSFDDKPTDAGDKRKKRWDGVMASYIRPDDAKTPIEEIGDAFQEEFTTVHASLMKRVESLTERIRPCLICKTQPMTCAASPCLHMFCCELCSSALRKVAETKNVNVLHCPVCKKPMKIVALEWECS